jgi:hypothetical protein
MNLGGYLGELAKLTKGHTGRLQHLDPVLWGEQMPQVPDAVGVQRTAAQNRL